ncbi:uncharacterized protein TNCT_316401 [Trichonephila clavata]|uniref:Uncharacterized protein n=1 Tax=Trichonephila clavata TaxID=2740835 RepID=A0A8X6M3P2_TRICU|nr:uncharacterized protein TNCT_316401 [Trichonephila clavata]
MIILNILKDLILINIQWQKPLQRSYDESNSRSSIIHSTPLPSFVTDSTEINDSYDSTEMNDSHDSTEMNDSHDSTEMNDSRDSTEMSDSRDSTERSDSRDSTERSDSRDSTEISDSRDSTEMSDSTEISDSRDSTEISDSRDSTEINDSRDSTEISDSYEDSTECVQVDQSNTARANYLEVVLKDLSDNLQDNCASNNAFVDLGILNRELVLHTTVKDFCSHQVVRNILSKLCLEDDSLPLFYLQEKYPEINGDFEIFLNCTVLSLVKKYAQDTIFDMFPRIEKLETEKISTNEIFQYFYERCNDNEVFYVSKFLCGDQLLTLAAVISRLNLIGLMLIYDDFNKGNKHWRDTFSHYNV